MNWPALSKHLIRLGGVGLATLILYVGARQTSLYEFTVRDAEGLHTLILLIGSIYAVVFAFVIFVIWGQFVEVENASIRECYTLNDLLRFSHFLNPDASRPIQRAVVEYAKRVVDSEWRALSWRHRDSTAERAFSALVNAVFRTVPTSPAEELVLQRLIDIARRAAEHRDERVAKSLTRIPPTLLALVTTMALALFSLVFVYPFHHWTTGVVGVELLVVVLFLADLVMRDTDNPFDGVCNVSPRPFSELMR